MADENTLTIKIDDEGLSQAPSGPPPVPQPVGPSFPSTVMGPRGQRIDIGAYQDATRQFEAEQRKKAAAEAYKNVYAGPEPPPLPKMPPPLPTAEPAGPSLMDQALKAAGISPAAMAAAGPIAIAAVAAQSLTTALQGMKRSVENVTRGLEAMIGNDYARPSEIGSSIGQGIADGMKSIPIFGEMVGAQMEMQLAILAIPDKLTDAFLSQAQKLAPYSGQISVANAMADYRQVTGDIREAQELGESMGRLVDSNSRFNAEMRELLLPIKKFLIEVLADRLELIADIAAFINNFPSLINETVSTLARAIVTGLDPLTRESAADVIEKLPERLWAIMNRQNTADGNSLLDRLLTDMQNAPRPDRPNQPAQPAPQLPPMPNVFRDPLTGIEIPVLGG